MSLRGVTKSFGGRLVLDRLDLELARDAVYVVRGPSGAGKSTLLNIVAGYVRPDSGTVERRERVGYLMQDELLFSELTVTETLRVRYLGLLASREYGTVDSYWAEADRWLDRLELAHLRESKVGTLSGGERRRLEIAAMALAGPGLLVLDEPTSGLDPESAKAVYSAVWGVRGSGTVMIATHETSIPELPESARELYLDGGKAREDVAE